MILFGELKDPANGAAAAAAGGGVQKCVDRQLWLACAGSMVKIPAVHSKVYYFPQGHAESAHGGHVDLGTPPRAPPLVLCRVSAVHFMADADTDEVFAKIRLVPVRADVVDDDLSLGSIGGALSEEQDKPASFAKTLTQSDANNGGGFSVPRYCAETIFPPLDYAAEPPTQTIVARDVHGVMWRFRHIFRGTPRRHLLTTGWSVFVNQKKLVAGDSIVFLRADDGELHVGIRRAKRPFCGGGASAPSPTHGWGLSASGECATGYGGAFGSAFLTQEGFKGLSCGLKLREKAGRVSAEAVGEAAELAGRGREFEVTFYPRGSTPEFCVRAAAVQAAMRVQWFPGMRFKMAFETEDSSRISWFMGTVSSAQVADPVRWPQSPWRLLQVVWDEPDLLHDVKRVSPWLVEVVSAVPAGAVHQLPQFSPPRKKPRCLPPDLMAHDVGARHVPLVFPAFAAAAAASLQGARHAQFSAPPPPLLDVSTDLTVGGYAGDIIPPCDTSHNDGGGKRKQLVLFGCAIYTDEYDDDDNTAGICKKARTSAVTGNASDSSESAVIHGVENVVSCDSPLLQLMRATVS